MWWSVAYLAIVKILNKHTCKYWECLVNEICVIFSGCRFCLGLKGLSCLFIYDLFIPSQVSSCLMPMWIINVVFLHRAAKARGFLLLGFRADKPTPRAGRNHNPLPLCCQTLGLVESNGVVMLGKCFQHTCASRTKTQLALLHTAV